jgi:two-component system CheB/CheR fusion protein
VTRFFRDQEAFDVLERQVLPELLTGEPRDVPLRFWVAGCATGEEAYSLAIVLRELMAKLGERRLQIFATDVHRESIEPASRGIYDADALVNVSKERLGRYFVRMGDAYQVVADPGRHARDGLRSGSCSRAGPSIARLAASGWG